MIYTIVYYDDGAGRDNGALGSSAVGLVKGRIDRATQESLAREHDAVVYDVYNKQQGPVLSFIELEAFDDVSDLVLLKATP